MHWTDYIGEVRRDTTCIAHKQTPWLLCAWFRAAEEDLKGADHGRCWLYLENVCMFLHFTNVNEEFLQFTLCRSLIMLRLRCVLGPCMAFAQTTPRAPPAKNNHAVINNDTFLWVGETGKCPVCQMVSPALVPTQHTRMPTQNGIWLATLVQLKMPPICSGANSCIWVQNRTKSCLYKFLKYINICI